LFIIANVNDNPALAKSTVSFEIKYQQSKAAQKAEVALREKQKAEDAGAMEKSVASVADEKAKTAIPEEAFTKVILNQRITPLKVTGFSKECDDEKCVFAQEISFEVGTQLLIEGQKDGFAFYLDKENQQGQSLGTMIPARYLTALFSK
jgi:hypothetical protein